MVVMRDWGLLKETGTELVPTARILEPSEMGVLEKVMAGAPGVRVVPATEMPVGRSWMAMRLMVVRGFGGGVGGGNNGRVWAVGSKMRLREESREMVVPDIRAAGAPAVRVVLWIETAFERGWIMKWFGRVVSGGGGKVGRG